MYRIIPLALALKYSGIVLVAISLAIGRYPSELVAGRYPVGIVPRLIALHAGNVIELSIELTQHMTTRPYL